MIHRTMLAAVAAVGLLILPPIAPARAAPACEEGAVTILSDSGPLTYTVEIADEPHEQARGLMFRTEMARDHGMLFVFPQSGPRAFWMKNTVLSLDIIFIDAAGRVVNVAENTTPYSERPIPSDGDALAVLELNAGEAARRGIGPGTQLIHPAFREAPLPHRCAD